VSIEKLEEFAFSKRQDIFEALFELEGCTALSSSIKEKFMGFRAIINNLIKERELLPLSEFAELLVDFVGIKQSYDIKNEDDRNKLENIDEFLSSVKQFESENIGATLTDFLQSITLISASDVEDSASVTVATVHAVKGLEYKAVFIAGAEEGIFPLSRAAESRAEMEEERRVFYVAVTRAMQHLYITAAANRYRFGKYENNMTSRFLAEAGLATERRHVQVQSFSSSHASSKMRDEARAFIVDFRSFTTSKAQKIEEKDLSAFTVGAGVLHPRYGSGKIVDLVGENAKIEFVGLGIKQFNLALAPLEVVNE
jgi:DNA helicase-2/ATP-dependent DNA helicase PcrA